MITHPNSQAKGPKLDRPLERYLYHRRGNFLSNHGISNLGQKVFSDQGFRKNLSGIIDRVLYAM